MAHGSAHIDPLGGRIGASSTLHLGGPAGAVEVKAAERRRWWWSSSASAVTRMLCADVMYMRQRCDDCDLARLALCALCRCSKARAGRGARPTLYRKPTISSISRNKSTAPATIAQVTVGSVVPKGLGTCCRTSEYEWSSAALPACITLSTPWCFSLVLFSPFQPSHALPRPACDLPPYIREVNRRTLCLADFFCFPHLACLASAPSKPHIVHRHIPCCCAIVSQR